MSEASDTLRSIARAKYLDLLCEGEIGGLINGARSIYLDDTPLQDAAGNFNFSGLTFSERKGTLTQPSIPGFSDAENAITVGVQVKQATPVVRAFTNSQLSAVKVIIGVPQLTLTSKQNGDIGPTNLNIAIDLQTSVGSWTQVVADRISGKTTTRYQRTYRINLPAGGAPWNIRVRRITDDPSDSYFQGETWWDIATEVTDVQLRYPHRAHIGLSFDAKSFQSIPRRAYDVRLKLVKVPSNYDPLTRAYTGTWDGTFSSTLQWTDNPAWCFFDLVTHPRYGLGGFVSAAQVDKWALYRIAQYCDELVPDGFGGMEPRFTCNLFLAERAEAFKVLNDLSSIFRSMIYWGSGTITAVQDAPADPVALFAPANVIGGRFGYSGSSMKARHTVALVTWNDPTDMFRQKVEYVEDKDGVARFGYVPTEVVAVGCSSRGQAARVGRWLLYTERLQTDAVVFKTGLEGAVVRPGNIIKVADPVRAGVRLGGRLLAATTTTATLDAPVTLVAGQTYTLSCIKADGTVQTGTVSTAAGTTASLTLSAPLAEAPSVGGMWMLTSAAVDAQLFRVMSATESTDADALTYEITAVEHDPGKFALVETGLALQPRSISALSARPAPPAALVLDEVLVLDAGAYASRLDASWQASEGAVSYRVAIQRDGGLTDTATVYGLGYELQGVVEGSTYTVTVYAISALGYESTTGTTQTITILGKAAPPSDVGRFVVARSGDSVSLSWDTIPDADADLYEIRRGLTWETSILVGSAVHPANTLTVQAPRGGTFLIKARDTSGNYSTGATAAVVPDSSALNVVLAYDEAAAGFPGTHSGTVGYSVTSSPSWDAASAWGASYTWTQFNNLRGVTLAPGNTSGNYTTAVIDIGTVAESLLTIDAQVGALGPLSGPWSSYTLPWSSYTGPLWVWTSSGAAVSAAYEVRTSLDGITWGAWSLFTPGAYRFRYLQARVTLATEDADFMPLMTALRMLVDVPDRVETYPDIAVPAGGLTLTFTPAFVGIQTVQATLQSAAVGDTVKVTAKSVTGVTLQVFNSAGTAKAGLLDVDVAGYGYRY